jgi:hypothetical protein
MREFADDASAAADFSRAASSAERLRMEVGDMLCIGLG